mmetsp:Transcript_27418/g.38774  ORF Transcript_27418/g.38774 Transcript_27418/m.38774 type:complete len:190 (+) Transcript_27418:31-600(+)
MAEARGKHETAILKANIDDQLNRLLTQLEDLEELKDEFEDGEYEETKAETLAQLREFQAFLEKTVSGDMTLIDAFGSAQLAIQAAISDAFKTPEVIRMFATKQPDQLRMRLAKLQRELKLKNLGRDLFNQQAAEILVALKKMGTSLSAEEQEFLDNMSNTRHLESAVGADKLDTSGLMSTAAGQIKQAQ